MAQHAPMPQAQVKPWGSLSWPNRISILRLLMVFPFFVLLMNQARWGDWARYTALAIFLAMAGSDLVDGMLARKLNARTRLGVILDPLADKVLIICAVVLLSLPHSAVPGARLPDYVVVLVVGKDLWVILGFVVTVLVTGRFRVQPMLAGKAATLAQLAMVAFVLIAPDLNRLLDGLGSYVALALSWAVGGLCVLAAISYTRLGLRFVAEGQKPLDDGAERPGNGRHDR